MAGATRYGRAPTVWLAVAMALAPAAALPSPETPLPLVGCGAHALFEMPCDDVQQVWWSETPGVGWTELTGRTLVSSDGTRVITAATLQGATDAGNGCWLSSTRSTDGVPVWRTIIPRTLGCSVLTDVALDDSSGDIVLTGLDFVDLSNLGPGLGAVDTGIAGAFRIDGASGTLVWARLFLDGVARAVAVDEAGRRALVVNWTTAHENIVLPYLTTLDLDTGELLSSYALRPDGAVTFYVQDLVFDPDRDLAFASGGGGVPDPAAPGGIGFRALAHAFSATSGAAVWTALDPTPGESWGGGIGFRAVTGRAFFATSSGLLTLDAGSGGLLGLAPLAGGTDARTMVSFYGVAYDEPTDTAVMAGGREPTEAGPGALVALAARGADGMPLWVTDVAPTDGPALAMPPVLGKAGDVWLAGAVADGAALRARVAAVDLAHGSVRHEATLEFFAATHAALHHVVPLASDEALVSGMVLREELFSSFDARVRFT